MCLANEKVMKSWAGTAVEWFVLELTIWTSFLFTLFLLMIKSRCCKVGIDNSKQFESQYMSYLVNKIIRALLDWQNSISSTAIYRRHKFVNKERDVEVDGVTVRIKLSEQNYMKILTQLQYGEKETFVQERNAI